jgi:hypothetical protein
MKITTSSCQEAYDIALLSVYLLSPPIPLIFYTVLLVLAESRQPISSSQNFLLLTSIQQIHTELVYHDY